MGTKIGFTPGRILSQSCKTPRWIVLGVLSGFILFLVLLVSCWSFFDFRSICSLFSYLLGWRAGARRLPGALSRDSTLYYIRKVRGQNFPLGAVSPQNGFLLRQKHSPSST